MGDVRETSLRVGRDDCVMSALDILDKGDHLVKSLESLVFCDTIKLEGEKKQ